MSQERQEPRPETSKCSRFEKRRMASQNQQRQKLQLPLRTTQNFYQPNYNGMTLDQYFRNKQNGDSSMKGTPKTKKFLVTSNEFFAQQQELQQQDLMRRTYMGESKYMNMKQDVSKRIQELDKDLFQKYANKFDLGNNQIGQRGKEQIFKLK